MRINHQNRLKDIDHLFQWVPGDGNMDIPPPPPPPPPRRIKEIPDYPKPVPFHEPNIHRPVDRRITFRHQTFDFFKSIIKSITNILNKWKEI